MVGGGYLNPRVHDLFLGIVMIAFMVAVFVAATAAFKLLILIADAINGVI